MLIDFEFIELPAWGYWTALHKSFMNFAVFWGWIYFLCYKTKESTFCNFLGIFATIKDMVKNRQGCIYRSFKKGKKNNEVQGNEKAKFAWQNKLTKTIKTSQNKAKNQQINNYKHILQITMDN